MSTNNYNIAVVGIAGVGKTTYMNRLINIPFKPQYRTNMDKQVYTINILGQNIGFHIYPGQDISNTNFGEVDAVIYMCDLTSPISVSNINGRYFQYFNKELPAIFIGAKNDIYERKVIGEPKHPDMPYFEISSKKDSVEKLFEPIISLVNILVN